IPAPVAAAAGEVEAMRLTPRDLAFDLAECGQVAHALLGRELDALELERLVTVTRGWPAAVVFALPSPRGPRFDRVGTGGLMQALVDTLLDPLDAEEQEMLARLAHLPLGDAEVSSAAAGPRALELA